MSARRQYVGSGSRSSNAAPPRGRARSRSLVASRTLPSTVASVPAPIVGKPNWRRVLNCAACQYSYSRLHVSIVIRDQRYSRAKL
jgi:hypothetical protein